MIQLFVHLFFKFIIEFVESTNTIMKPNFYELDITINVILKIMDNLRIFLGDFIP